jgi:soluble lytic murein transglycosylase-like protein
MKRLTLEVRDYIMAVIGALLALLIMGGIALLHNHQTPLPYEDAGVTAAWIPSTVTHYDDTINEMAKKYDINANILAILMTMESGGNPKAHSEADARGLMQITPTTAKDIAARYVQQPTGKYDLYDAKTSIEFGAAYLAILRDEYGTMHQAPTYNETVELIAAAYNGGFGAANALEKGEGLRDTQTVIYSRDAYNMWRERVSSKSPTFDRWKERGGQALLDAAKKSQQ